MRRVFFVLALAAMLAGPGHAAALRGAVLGNGAARAAAAGKSFEGTVGQAVVGVSSGAVTTAYHGFWVAGGARVLAADDGPGADAARHAVRFGPPSPNPSRAAVAFGVSLATEASVVMEVLDLQGRRVASVAPGRLAAGEHRLVWDGRIDGGSRAAAGVFFARLSLDGRPIGSKRIVLSR